MFGTVTIPPEATHFQLHLTHQLHTNLPGGFVPAHPQLRIFFLQLAQVHQQRALRQRLDRLHLHAHQRHGFGRFKAAIRANALPRFGRKPCQRDGLPRMRFAHRQ